jgi:hypothetical protein
VCWVLFALIFVVESSLSFYIDILGIPMMLENVDKEDIYQAERSLKSGINLKHIIKIVLQQSLIFVVYKTIEFIVFTIK